MTFGQSANRSFPSKSQSSLLEQFQKTVDQAMVVSSGGNSIIADKVLDAPGFTGDAVLNTLAGSLSGIFAAALSNRIYIWEPGNTKLM